MRLPQNLHPRICCAKAGHNPEPEVEELMSSFFERLRARRLSVTFAALAAISAMVLMASYAVHGVHGQSKQNDSADATPLKVSDTSVAPNNFVKIAKEVGPAVVNINTRTLPSHARKANPHGQIQPVPEDPDGGDSDNGGAPGNGQGPDQNFQDFFNRFFGGQAPNGPSAQPERDSLGSGFIVDPKGYIITNNHVVDGADEIYVKLSTDPDTTDRGRKARVIGVDKATDLAVIKIDTDKPLPTVKLGNSDNAQVGEWAIAIGSPFALSQTVTAGIISAKNRTIEPGAAGQFQHFIQTDAAINPGNSGGPLVNMNGEVIGVNTAIYTQSSGYQGIGFAMPANTVAQVYNDLISPRHKVVRGSIGISFREGQSSAVGRVYGFTHGVIVQQVQPGGPADKGGIKIDDVIVSIDGRQIKNGDDLVADIASRRPGSTVRLGYLRDGKPMTASVVVGDRDQIFSSMLGENNAAPSDNGTSSETKLGITVREVGPQMADKMGRGGMLIVGVKPSSFADELGLQPGLAITRINKIPVGTRAQFDSVVSGLHSGSDVVFEVMDPKHPEDGINLLGGTLP